MSRELVVLGTASAVPTRHRNHNGYLLRWDGQGYLFDPGEGTQRQMLHAGVSANDVHWICVTHFHGDHCLGVPGLVQRIARDRVRHPVRAVYPASGETYWRRLRHAAAFADTDVIEEHPVTGALAAVGPLTAPPPVPPRRVVRLPHPGARRHAACSPRGSRPTASAAPRSASSSAPAPSAASRSPSAASPGPGRPPPFIMDTRLCDAAFELASGVDLLIIESTFLSSEGPLAKEYGHLTAFEAGLVAADAGARRLVLTHFSERYGFADEPAFLEEVRRTYDGDVTLARDLMTVPVPRRRR